MEARPSKRRKLSPQPTSKAKSSPIASRKNDARNNASSPVICTIGHSANINVSGERSAVELWQQAKAKQQAQRSKKELDVYDDFEGAHRGWGDAQPKLKPSAGSAKKSVLDPLRNQKAAAGVSPKKSGTSLNFFKQFAAAPAEKNGSGEKQRGRFTGASALLSMQDNEEDELAAEESPVPIARKKTKIKPSWHYDVVSGNGAPSASHKTFEDEIRELEENARKVAEAEESEAESGAQISSRRASARRPTQNLREAVSQPEQSPAAKSSPKAMLTPLDRRKAAQVKKHKNASAGIDLEEQVEHASETRLSGQPKSAQRDTHSPAAESDAEDAMEVDDLPKRRRPASKKKLNTLLKDAVTPRKELSQPVRIIATTPSATFQSDQLQCLRTIAMERATGKRSCRLTNLDDEYTKVATLVDQTISAGESNSMLLIGARGSGKSALVNAILEKHAQDHRDDFHVVRLNGFVHTDDKIASREIWRQLGREMELDEGERTSKNYADTLTTLLALLSQPAENGLDEPGKITKSIVFIIDEFELFAGHPRQTLLYNLFDVAQSRKAPIAVLGLTTRIDVAESLEKRVKSRFSHRYVHISLAKSFQAFEQSCKAAVALASEELTDAEATILGATKGGNGVLQEALAEDQTRSQSVIRDWNVLVDDFFSTDSVSTYLRRLYYTTKSVPDFLTSLLMPFATIPAASSITSAELLSHLTSTFAPSLLRAPDSKLDLLSSLSVLQLALLICAARLNNIYSTELVSFNLAYEEYKVLASKAKIQASAAGALAQGAGSRVWSKQVAKGAWEELMGCGLVVEDGRGGGAGRVDVGLEEIGISGVELGQWGRWCKEI